MFSRYWFVLLWIGACGLLLSSCVEPVELGFADGDVPETLGKSIKKLRTWKLTPSTYDDYAGKLLTQEKSRVQEGVLDRVSAQDRLSVSSEKFGEFPIVDGFKLRRGEPTGAVLVAANSYLNRQNLNWKYAGSSGSPAEWNDQPLFVYVYNGNPNLSWFESPKSLKQPLFDRILLDFKEPSLINRSGVEKRYWTGITISRGDSELDPVVRIADRDDPRIPDEYFVDRDRKQFVDEVSWLYEVELPQGTELSMRFQRGESDLVRPVLYETDLFFRELWKNSQ